MKYRSLLRLTLVLALLPGCSRPLPRAHWEKDTWKALSALIRTEGRKDAVADPADRPYAVFDFDNTTILGDVELNLFAWQISQLRYRISPEDMEAVLLGCVPDPGLPLQLEGLSPGVTARMLAADICDDYRILYDDYIARYADPSAREAGKALAKVTRSRAFKDFRAKMWALSAGVEATFDAETGLLWPLRLFSGMTRAEIRELTRAATASQMRKGRIRLEKWESPDMGLAGRVRVVREDGLAVAREMKDLYNALMDYGFDVYICSGSMEEVVETMAGDPQYGFRIPPEQVFGVRVAGADSVRMTDVRFDRNAIQPWQEGKVLAIRRYIAPAHGDRGPALVAGDSNGDFDMLTGFPDLRIGLIVNCLRGGPIAELTEYALTGNRSAEDPIPVGGPGTEYLLQGRDPGRGRFIREKGSKPVK